MAKKEANKKEMKKQEKNKKSFFKDFKAELKKVIWPTPKQLVNNTTAVITIVLITALIVFVLDLTFESLNKHGVDKLKEFVGTSNKTSENVTTENTSDDNTSEDNNATDENTDNSTEQNQQEEETPENNAQ